jgi:hypothetical protein
MMHAAAGMQFVSRPWQFSSLSGTVMLLLAVILRAVVRNVDTERRAICSAGCGVSAFRGQ